MDLGKIRFYFSGDYSAGTTYELNDVVKYGGNVYVYINTTSAAGNLPTNTTYWAVMNEGFNYLGSYSNATAYKPGDTVSHGGNLYLCENPSTGNTPPNATYWSRITAGIRYSGAYNNSATYLKDDVVAYGGSSFVALQDGTGNTPSSSGNTAYWAKLVDGTYPNQAGNANKILKTDGTSTSWTDTPSVDKITGKTKVYGGTNAQTYDITTATLTGSAAVFDMNSSPYGQIAVHNQNTTSSSDLIVYAADGTDTEGWIDLGITGPSFAQGQFGITGPHDGYIFMEAPTGTSGNGDLVLATGSNGTRNAIVLAAGGFGTGTEQVTIIPNNRVHIEIPTQSTSSTTGALTVAGGMGVQGNVNVAGNVSIVGNLSFGGGSTTTANLSVSDPLVFVGNANNTDTSDLGIVGEYATTVSAITASVSNKALSNNVATLTTSAAHTYLVGDWVVITNVDATFNGTYQIVAVPTSTTFTYAKTASNVTSAAVSPTGTATVNARRKFAGALRDATDGVFKFFRDATSKPTSTINFSEAGLTFAPIQTGAITAGGNVGITGTLGASGNFAINTNKFNVTASSGDTTIAGSLGVTGLTTLNGGISSSGTVTLTGGVSLSGNVDVQELRESTVDVTLSSNAGTLDWTLGNIYYIANAPTGNMTFNVTNVPTDSSKIMTINVLVTQGSTGYIPGTFQIGGASQTIKWAGGSAPSATNGAGKIDIFSFTMFRTSSNTWIVFGTVANNF